MWVKEFPSPKYLCQIKFQQTSMLSSKVMNFRHVALVGFNKVGSRYSVDLSSLYQLHLMKNWEGNKKTATTFLQAIP
jgi:hypothetical protein